MFLGGLQEAKPQVPLLPLVRFSVCPARPILGGGRKVYGPGAGSARFRETFGSVGWRQNVLSLNFLVFWRCSSHEKELVFGDVQQKELKATDAGGVGGCPRRVL